METVDRDHAGLQHAIEQAKIGRARAACRSVAP